MGLLHAVAERLEETCGHLSPADAFGVELHGTAGRAGEEAHPEPPGIRADLGAEWPRGGRGRVRVSRHVPRDHVEHRSRVADGARDDVLDRHALPDRPRVRAERRSPA